MKRIGDFALVAIAITLLVGLFLFRDHERYSLIQNRGIIVYLIDKHTGEVWISISPRKPVFKKIEFASMHGEKIESKPDIIDPLKKLTDEELLQLARERGLHRQETDYDRYLKAKDKKK